MAEKPRTVLGGLAFPEGPRWREGELVFSDMHADEVVAMTPDGRRRTVFKHDQPVSGLGWLPDGRMLVVSMNDRKLMRIEADGSAVLHADLGSIATGNCNDMVVDGRRPRLCRQFRRRLPTGACRSRPRWPGSTRTATVERRGRGPRLPERDDHHARRQDPGRRRDVRRSADRVRRRVRRQPLEPPRLGADAARRCAGRHLPRRRGRDLGRLADVERGDARARGRGGDRAHRGRPRRATPACWAAPTARRSTCSSPPTPTPPNAARRRPRASTPWRCPCLGRACRRRLCTSFPHALERLTEVWTQCRRKASPRVIRRTPGASRCVNADVRLKTAPAVPTPDLTRSQRDRPVHRVRRPSPRQAVRHPGGGRQSARR